MSFHTFGGCGVAGWLGRVELWLMWDGRVGLSEGLK